jgi:hypothetical protein
MNKPEVKIASASAKFGENGTLTDEAARDIVRGFLVVFTEWSRRFRGT